MYIRTTNFDTYQLFFSFFLTFFIYRVIKDFMIQGGDFVKVSFKSCLEDTSVQFYVYILYTVMWIYFLDYISKNVAYQEAFTLDYMY